MPETPDSSRNRIVYLVGPGRSGTTILAAILASHPEISWYGELTHLANWNEPECTCTCGEAVRECAVWKSRSVEEVVGPAMVQARDLERNRAAIGALMNPGHFPPEYCRSQTQLVQCLGGGERILLDSSKWVGRAIGLSRCHGLDARYIYLVRDARGIVFSFGKAVQYRRGLLSACMYYLAVSVAAQCAAWTRLRGRCVKIKYEDLVSEPDETLSRIGENIGIDMKEVSTKLAAGGEYGADHGVGGNRWLKSGTVTLRGDRAWRDQMAPWKRVLVHALCWPFQVLNGYGI